jgi:hypothetical protein
VIRAWYFYSVTPFVLVVATAVLLTIPYLALAVFMIVVLGALAALAWTVIRTTSMLVRAVTRYWRGTSNPDTEAAPAVLSPGTRHQSGSQNHLR